MKNYVIPFFYTFFSRIKDEKKRVAYMFTFIIPVFLYGFLSACKQTEDIYLITMGIIMSLIGTMSVYEIGYIRNDVFAIEKENNPTLRLNGSEINYVKKNIVKITVIKYSISLISLILLYIIGFDILGYLAGLILIRIFYLVHNTFREKVSIISFFILSTLRYIVPLLILKTNILELILVFVFVISIPRTLEKLSGEKFSVKILKKINSNLELNLLRTLYYLVLVASVSIQYYMYKSSSIFLILAIYYLIYRGGIYVVVFMKNKGIRCPKNR